jgi:hypothetical protein
MKMGDTALAMLWSLFLSGILLFGWAAAAPPAIHASTPALVRIGSGETPIYPIAPGGERAVTVEVVGAANLATASLLLTYDPTLLQVVSCEAHSSAAIDLTSCNATYSASQVKYSLLSPQGVNGDHTLFTVVFRAIGGAGATAALSLSADLFADPANNALPLTLAGGSLSIEGTPAPVDATLALLPQNGSIVPGEYTVISVTLNVAGLRLLAAATLFLQYDPALVRPVACTRPASSSLPGSCNHNFDPGQGIIKFNILSEEGAAGLLHLYDITFETAALATPGEGSPLILSVQNIYDTGYQAMSWQVVHGSLTVVDGPSNAALILVGAPDTDGRITVSAGTTFTVPVWIKDVVNLGAATIALTYDSGLLDGLSCTLQSQTDGIDGGSCALHAGKVQANLIASQGFSGALPVFEILFFSSANTSVAATRPLTLDVIYFADPHAGPIPRRVRQGVIDIIPGDLSGLASIHFGHTPVGEPLSLPLAGQVTATVALSQVTNLGAATLVVEYDPAVARAVSCTSMGTFDLNVCNIDGNEVRLNLLSAEGFSGAAPLATVQFQAADGASAGDQTPLTLRVANFMDPLSNPILYRVETGTLVIAEADRDNLQALLDLGGPAYLVEVGETIGIPVRATVKGEATAGGLSIASMRLNYDPLRLRPVSCILDDDDFIGGACNLESAPGEIRFNLISEKGVTGRLTLATVLFEALGPPGSTSAVTLGVQQLADMHSNPLSYLAEAADVQIQAEDDGTSILGDLVWVDTLENGLQDAGEVGLNGVVVNLLDGNGVVLATRITANDSNGDPGYYRFTGLAAGVYQVEFVLPTSYIFTRQNVDELGVAGAANSDADRITGRTDQVVLAQGEQNLAVDAGLVAVATSVTLLDFRAAPVAARIMHLEWSTASERNLQGFHLWRSQNGDRSQATPITAQLIEATGDPLFGTEYLFVDTLLQPDTEYTYWLQQIDVTGTATEYGPVTGRTPPEPTDEPHIPAWQTKLYLPLLGGR